MLFADLDGVISTHVDDRAFQTDFLGPLFSPPFLASTFEPRRREEDRLIWAAAGGRVLPGSIPTPSTNWVHECHLNFPLSGNSMSKHRLLTRTLCREYYENVTTLACGPDDNRGRPCKSKLHRNVGKRSSRCWNRLLDRPRRSRRQLLPSGHGRGSRGRRPPRVRFRG